MNKQARFQITDEEVWYIIINNETRGPLSLRDLDVLLRTNDINSRTFAWKSGMAQWKVLNNIQEIKASILESSKEILQIQKKRQHLFDKPPQKKQNEEGNVQDLNNQIIENKDQNALTILQSTVQNLIKKTFHQSNDGKWNVYDEEKAQWVQQDSEPIQKIQKMKQLLFNKLKNELFFDDKNKRKKANVHQNEQNKQPQLPLTQQQIIKREKNKKKTKRQAQKKKKRWYDAKINTFIYISGLPLDVAEEQLKQFVNKAGVLRIDLNTGKQKLKLYRDENGALKGDAAVSYVRQQSVQIAIELLNNKQIRSGFKVNIQKAKFNQKQQDYKPRQTKKQSLAKKIQQKMLKKKQFSWDEQIDQQGDGLKIVIMKHMFDYQQSNEEYMQSIKNDITQQLTKIGQIQRIRFYQSHPDGVIQVKFKHQKSAQSCISAMNGRFFDGRQIECDYWDGQTDYKKDAGSLLLQQERLSKFGQQIQGKEQEEGANNVLQKVQQVAEQQNQQQINNHLLEDN